MAVRLVRGVEVKIIPSTSSHLVRHTRWSVTMLGVMLDGKVHAGGTPQRVVWIGCMHAEGEHLTRGCVLCFVDRKAHLSA